MHDPAWNRLQSNCRTRGTGDASSTPGIAIASHLRPGPVVAHCVPLRHGSLQLRPLEAVEQEDGERSVKVGSERVDEGGHRFDGGGGRHCRSC